MHVDIATDAPSSGEVVSEEDCSTFRSEKTGRGPLVEGWKVQFVYFIFDF